MLFMKSVGVPHPIYLLTKFTFTVNFDETHNFATESK